MCEMLGINMQPPEVRRKTHPRRLQDFVVNAETTLREPMQTSEKYRIHCFFPVIDRLVSELTRRFSSESCHILKGVAAVNPKHQTFLNKTALLPMARHYGVLEDNLAAEVHQLRRLIERKKQNGDTVSTTQDLLILLRPYKDAFTDFYKLVCISLILPVSTAACERSFSCLRRLKNYLRNKSGDARTSNLGLMAISAGRTKQLDVEVVIDRFAANHNNRRIVLFVMCMMRSEEGAHTFTKVAPRMSIEGIEFQSPLSIGGTSQWSWVWHEHLERWHVYLSGGMCT
ncbi:hypothetical protein WMY93_013931 [Mugilogobius chulae]|uniref:HAT C-terminal dimerisation domain-containing protein n=1 Tax=Mugilogobius chulae TaxID=88201 RepID=A0AAW0P4Y6_9GOBI